MKLSKNRLSKLAGILSEGNDRDLDEIEDVTSEDALFDKDPADDPEAETGTGGEPSGDGYIQEMRHIQRAVLQEMNKMEEGVFDFLRGKTEPRGPWKDATGMSHPDMIGYQPESVDSAAYDLAVALANRIESYAAGWSGPESGGATADYERAGWHRIADPTGQGHWDAVLHTVGPATADQAEAVLNQWEKDGYIVRTEPDVLSIKGLGRASGIWLRWGGYQALRRARDAGKKSASIQYGTY